MPDSGNGNGNGRKRGRPPGKKNQLANFTNWIPKEWTPVYEEIVLLSCSGTSNVELAERYGFTKEHISNVLRTPQAAILRRQVLDNLHERALEKIPEKLNSIAMKTVERVRDLMNNDDLFMESPFAVVDRGLKVLVGTGHLSKEKDSGGINVKNAVILTKEHSEDMISGLKRAAEAEKLHSGVEVHTKA